MNDDFYSVSVTRNFYVSSTEKESKNINAVDYLRAFILSELKLTKEDQRHLAMILHPGMIEEIIPEVEESQEKRRCKVCGKLKGVNEFYNYMRTCKECYNAERKRKREGIK